MPKRKNPVYVTRQECAEITSAIREELQTIRVALLGNNMRGGIVGDIMALKKERSFTIEIVKTIVVPIIIAILTALIMSSVNV